MTTIDGMTPVVTVTDASTAFLIATALRSQADANRRVADRFASPAYTALSAAMMRQAQALITHAQRLDNIATDVEVQGIRLTATDFQGDDAPTVTMPRVSLDMFL